MLLLLKQTAIINEKTILVNKYSMDDIVVHKNTDIWNKAHLQGFIKWAYDILQGNQVETSSCSNSFASAKIYVEKEPSLHNEPFFAELAINKITQNTPWIRKFLSCQRPTFAIEEKTGKGYLHFTILIKQSKALKQELENRLDRKFLTDGTNKLPL